MIVSSAFAGKSYAVLGLARSGLATVECLAASGARLIAWDNHEEAREAVADKATVPIYYESRIAKLGLNASELRAEARRGV